MGQPPLVSVVIPSRSRARELERCLGAVARLDYARFETVVVDNSSGDEATRAIAERHGARYIVEQRRGVSFARNCGAHAARGEIIAYVDDDAVPEPDWLGALSAEFADPSVAVVAGPYLPLEAAGLPGFFGGNERKLLDRSVEGWFEAAAFGGFARAGNLAVRASTFERWHGFEPRLGRGTPLRAAEDDYAVLELIDLGYRVVYTPAAVVRHSFPADPRDYRRKFIVEKGLFIGFLLSANRRYRREILRYLAGRLTGKRLHRSHSAQPHSSVITHLVDVAAGTKGLLLFAALQLSRRIRRRRDAEMPSQP